MAGLYTNGGAGGNGIYAVKTYITTKIEPAAEFIGNQFVSISSYPPGFDSIPTVMNIVPNNSLEMIECY